MPKVSVVIPCFNLGKFIQETIDSVLAQTFQDFEIIVVNDGSTDAQTNNIIENLSSAKIKVLSTDNQGLSAARNNGISEATGEYILPIDADDKIAPAYLEKAVKILDENENTGIVYCEAEFFGEDNFKWDLPDFELSRMLIDNLIFCSALFRRGDWQKVGGYRSSMIYGWEDYDFWLSLIELKREVYRIPETLFFYRVRNNSMVNSMSEEQLIFSHKQLVRNHKELYFNEIGCIFKYIYSLRHDIEDFGQQLISKDTEIHSLNIQSIKLNAIIDELRLENADLKARLSNWRILVRQLVDVGRKNIFSDK